MDIYTRLNSLNITLPEPYPPFGVYLSVKQSGNLLFTSGILPVSDGKQLYTGKIGGELTVEQGQEAAKVCVLNALSKIHAHTKNLNSVKSIVKMLAFVASAPGFNKQGLVMNAGSQLLIDIFDSPAGEHVRTAIGVNEIPHNAPVEIEMIVEV
ncbi:MAG: RidA family protein [Deferribacteraceae bacterium]|jgi:enamine deaminase RidA (YjgF/YER057c/UK114 family)|nr:RidA family protein [Deferribacteraceae bacterium]